MEQYIVSSNSALELKLGNYNTKKNINVKIMLYTCIPNIYFYF